MADRVDIAPGTKLADLLDSWPGLEDELIKIAPPFAKLRNPVLRRTIARVTTLRQAAGVGGVPLPELIARLRSAAGLEEIAVDGGGAARVVGTLPGATAALHFLHGDGGDRLPLRAARDSAGRVHDRRARQARGESDV